MVYSYNIRYIKLSVLHNSSILYDVIERNNMVRKKKKCCSSGCAKVSNSAFGTVYVETREDGSAKVEFNLFNMGE